MATSSIKRSFVVSGEAQVKKFVEALELSEKISSMHTSVSARQIHGETELREFMRKRAKRIKEQ